MVKRTSILDINQQDAYGFTALHHAFFNKDILSFATLLANHADAFQTRDIFGSSVADLVAIEKHVVETQHAAGKLQYDPCSSATPIWDVLHLPMCRLVFGSMSPKCRTTNASSFARCHAVASDDTHQAIAAAGGETATNVLPSDGLGEVGWAVPWPNMTVDWAPLRIPPPNANGIRVFDARNTTIADVIRSIARAEPIVIRNAMVSLGKCGWCRPRFGIRACRRLLCRSRLFMIGSCLPCFICQAACPTVLRKWKRSNLLQSPLASVRCAVETCRASYFLVNAQCTHTARFHLLEFPDPTAERESQAGAMDC